MLTVIWHRIKQDNGKKHKRKQILVMEDTSFCKRLLLATIQEGGGKEGLLMAALKEGGGEMG